MISTELAEKIVQWREELQDKTPRNIIRWAIKQFGDQLVQASGLGAEDQMLTHIFARALDGKARVVFVDTGRHFQQTHELLQETAQSYDLDLTIHLPNGEALEDMVASHGANLFRQNTVLRGLCCHIRKEEPLKRALAPFDAWISGKRRDQSPSRQNIEVVEWDKDNDLIAINPLWNWREKEVWDYIRLNSITVHELHEQGYAFPGCAPCTRALKPGEAFCAGRWWWEQKNATRDLNAPELV